MTNGRRTHGRCCAQCGNIFASKGSRHKFCGPLCVFNARVVRGEEDECWPWPGCLDAGGYGFVVSGNVRIRAHRISLISLGINLQGDDCVLHECDNPPCVNQRHLSVGTRGQNIKDAWDRGLCPRGQDHHCAILDLDEVKAIRSGAYSHLSQTEIGNILGVTAGTISSILTRKSWKHV